MYALNHNSSYAAFEMPNEDYEARLDFFYALGYIRAMMGRNKTDAHYYGGRYQFGMEGHMIAYGHRRARQGKPLFD